jgi:hypothetical protein
LARAPPRRRLRPLPRYNESRISFISSITDMTDMTDNTNMTATSGVMVEPAEQQSIFQHSVRAQPSFELRQSPPGSWAFQVRAFAVAACCCSAPPRAPWDLQ